MGGATLNEGNQMKTYLNFRNSLCMLTKNLPKNQLLPILFIRLVLDGLAGIQFICKGKFKHCLAIIHAHFAFYKHFRQFYNKRTLVQKSNYYKINSVVYNYFIKNGKIFAKLF